jgi:hypothetical protein
MLSEWAHRVSAGWLSGGGVRRTSLLAVPLALLVVIVMAAHAQAYLYFGQGNGTNCPIGRANLDGTGLDHSFIIQGTCGSPAVNAAHIYWLYSGSRHAYIARANIDGTGVDRSFIALKGSPGGVAVDDAHIYWSDTTGIGRANIDGSGVDPTFLRLRSRTGQIAVDPKHIYWSDTAGIGRANLDGTHPEPGFIAPRNPRNIDGIAIDSAHIYWANFGGLSVTSPPGTIGRANRDGSGVNSQFITGAHNPSGIGVDGSHVYWANYGSGTIGRAHLDGTAVNENFIRRAGATGLAVDAGAPRPGGPPPHTLRGTVRLTATGGKVHGYGEGLTATFGTPQEDSLVFGLGKTRRPIPGGGSPCIRESLPSTAPRCGSRLWRLWGAAARLSLRSPVVRIE